MLNITPPCGSLFLVRHTPVNVHAGTCYGRTDVPLDDAALARLLPALHAQLPLQAVMLCSPLSRCLRLARGLQALSQGRTIVVEPRLIERDFGEWEGRRWDDIPHEQIHAWAMDFLNYAPPGGESVSAMAKRSLSTLTYKPRTDHAAVVISHAGPLAAIAAHFNGVALSATSVGQQPGTVVTLPNVALDGYPQQDV